MGHSAGDVLIRGIATVLREAVGNEGKIYRIGGDEFVVLIHDITDDGIEKVLKRIEKCRVKYNEENNVNLDFARGVSLYTEGDTTFENLVAKEPMRKCTEINVLQRKDAGMIMSDKRLKVCLRGAGSVFGGVDSFLYSCNMRSEYTKSNMEKQRLDTETKLAEMQCLRLHRSRQKKLK